VLQLLKQRQPLVVEGVRLFEEASECLVSGLLAGIVLVLVLKLFDAYEQVVEDSDDWCQELGQVI
jgi:hypothetical protein